MADTRSQEPDGAALLDRDHLAAQTMGDETLAAELLAMLRAQLAELEPAMARADAKGRAAIAHRMAGGARSLGAARLAAAAAAAAAAGGGGREEARFLAEGRRLAAYLAKIAEEGAGSVD